jgi:hypothetical protein
MGEQEKKAARERNRAQSRPLRAAMTRRSATELLA